MIKMTEERFARIVKKVYTKKVESEQYEVTKDKRSVIDRLTKQIKNKASLKFGKNLLDKLDDEYERLAMYISGEKVDSKDIKEAFEDIDLVVKKIKDYVKEIEKFRTGVMKKDIEKLILR